MTKHFAQDQIEQSLNRLLYMFNGISSIQVHQDATTQYSISNIDFSFFNSITQFLIPSAGKTVKQQKDQQTEIEKRVRDIKRQAAKRHVPLLWWVPGEDTQLLLSLRRSGFEYADTLTGMHAPIQNLLHNEADNPLPEDCRFTMVATADEEKTWNQIVATTFGLPLLYGELFLKASKCYIHEGREPTVQPYALNFLLYQQDTAVGTASVFLGGPVADFYNVAILPEHQGKGLGKHLMRGCLRAIAARGRDDVVLQATEAGKPLYHQLGFSSIHEILRLQWFPR